jgi:hypothetical protein
MLRHRDFTSNSQLAKSLFTSTIRHPVVRIARSPSLSSFMRERQKPILILRKTQDVRRLIGYWPTGVSRFAFEGFQHVGEASLMIFIDRAIGCNDDHARQARRAKGPEGFAVQIDKR